jgi:hypothetical protein
MRTPPLAALAAAAALLACEAGAAEAADPCGSDKASDVLACYSVDLSIPDTPGLAIVGLGAEEVLRPTSPRALGMAIQQGLDANGKPRQGLAFDIAPLKLLRPGLTKQDYRDSRFVLRPLWNSQLSFGVAKPTSDTDTSTRIGLGLSSVLWRNASSDPLLDEKHRDCLATAASSQLPDTFPGVGAVQVLPFTDEMKACYAGLASRTWNSSSLLVALAAARISGDAQAGSTPNSRPRGAWVTFSYGFEGIPSLQPTLHFTATFRRLSSERVPDPLDSTSFVEQDSRFLGAKLFRRGDSTNASLEYGVQRASIAGRPRENTRRYAFGVERKISDNLWLVAAVGSRRGGAEGSETFVTSGLKFGTASESAIKDH